MQKNHQTEDIELQNPQSSDDLGKTANFFFPKESTPKNSLKQIVSQDKQLTSHVAQQVTNYEQNNQTFDSKEHIQQVMNNQVQLQNQLNTQTKTSKISTGNALEQFQSKSAYEGLQSQLNNLNQLVQENPPQRNQNNSSQQSTRRQNNNAIINIQGMLSNQNQVNLANQNPGGSYVPTYSSQIQQQQAGAYSSKQQFEMQKKISRGGGNHDEFDQLINNNINNLGTTLSKALPINIYNSQNKNSENLNIQNSVLSPRLQPHSYSMSTRNVNGKLDQKL
ncbi:hypothetical protein TTHERM_00540460 (macronuclear) [Tetrahymena thermophila SB210]|uniref:Uncharacterized protein n=1 Tax=Tetrahymena thermophila (strain SB210) TaxID=312017 RepID=I7MDJ5_TETTS|nr:hypothetical protein TTHERM_00540460 [Tetrahymena thermophila SB210]EAR87726.1 hypothetical protein TTHERM_00540460 [Tetrahymena thermophila SB210]|eukprot:XP_001007971.1 hypothetical protein TTHERM_00540460 [Tetrahymena thermophila SB210]